MPANPLTAPREWDVFKINGEALPGLARVSGCVEQAKLDVRQAAGQSGAIVVFRGLEPKAFKVELLLSTEGELTTWDIGPQRKLLMTPPVGMNRKPFKVEHPACQYANITTCLRQSVSAPEPVGDGSYLVTIELMPAKPPKPAIGAITPADQPAPAKDALDLQLEALLKKAGGG